MPGGISLTKLGGDASRAELPNARFADRVRRWKVDGPAVDQCEGRL